MNSVKGIVKQIISLMHSWEATENYGTYQHKQIVPESLLKTVPKEWNYIPREMKRKESGKCRSQNNGYPFNENIKLEELHCMI